MGLFNFFKSEGRSKLNIDLNDFKFISNDHIRYENGKNVSGNNPDAWRGIRIQKIPNELHFTVTMYNLDGNHPVWGNNIQMAPKPMKIIEQNSDKIVLRGFGQDALRNSFSDYGITINLVNKEADKVVLHMFDRNIDIVYYNSNSPISTLSNVGALLSQIEENFELGVKAAYNGNNINAIKYFKKALALKKDSQLVNKDWESCCWFNIAEAQKQMQSYKEAIDSYNYAINVNPQNEDAYLGIAECYFAQESKESLKNVIEILNACTSLFPNNETAHFNTAIAHYKLSEPQKALNSFVKARSLGCEDAELYIHAIQRRG